MPRSGASGWQLGIADMQDAARHTTDAAPGPDGIPYALWRLEERAIHPVWCVLDAVVGVIGGGDPAEFGAIRRSSAHRSPT